MICNFVQYQSRYVAYNKAGSGLKYIKGLQEADTPATCEPFLFGTSRSKVREGIN